MSFIDKTKDFFGLGPVDIEEDDAYYNEEPRYSENSSSAYAPVSYTHLTLPTIYSV